MVTFGVGKVQDKIGGMSMYIIWVQYFNGGWCNVCNGDWPREEVILLGNDLV